MIKNRQMIREAKRKGYYATIDGLVISPSGKVLKLTKANSGYLRFSIRFNGKREHVLVHKLVAYLKFGEIALSSEVRHFDNNKSNLRWDNILLGTHSENMMDKSPSDRLKRALNATSYLRKLTDLQRVELREDKDSGMTISDILIKYHIPKSTMYYNLKQSVAQSG